MVCNAKTLDLVKTVLCSHILKCDLSIQTLFLACIGKSIVAEVFRISYFIGYIARTNRLFSLVESMSGFHISELIYLRCVDVQTSENTNIKVSAPIRQSVFRQMENILQDSLT